MKSRNYAIINEDILFTYTFFSNGNPIDVSSWTKIEIYDDDPRINLSANIVQTILPADIIRISTGEYQAIMDAVTLPKTYYDKQIYIDWDGITQIEYNSTKVRLAVDEGVVRKKKGFSFNNPDLDYNGGWGNIITPDEVRLIYIFGNPIVAPNGEALQDDALQVMIDNAVGLVERELNIKLIKKKFIARGPNMDSRPEISGTPGIDYEYDEPYDFDREIFNNKFMYIKLRNRPINKVYQVIFRDPLNNTVADITTWCKPNYERGSVEFFPQYGNLNMMFLQSSWFVMGNFINQTEKYPDAFYIDYDAGLDSVLHMRKKYPELFAIIGSITAIQALLYASIGRASGIASQSISMEGITESYSTTMSPENIFYGSEVRNHQKIVSDFMKANRWKYSGLQLAAF